MKFSGTISRDKVVVAEENGKKFIIKNSQQVEVEKIKLCEHLPVIQVQCDYIFKVIGKKISYYVELKGRNIAHAYEQLFASLELFHASDKNGKYCCIVCSQVPRLSASTIANRARAIKKFGIKNIFTKEHVLEVDLAGNKLN